MFEMVTRQRQKKSITYEAKVNGQIFNNDIKNACFLNLVITRCQVFGVTGISVGIFSKR